MATTLKTANFNGSIGSYVWIELSYDVLSQDNARLQSNLRYYLRFKSGNANGGGSASGGYINGTYVGSISSFGTYADILVGTKDVTIQHSSDGTATASYSASISTPWNGVGSASLSGSFAVPPLSGASTINSVTGEPADIQGNYDVEGTFSATYTKYVQGYIQRLRVSIPMVVALAHIENYQSGAEFDLSDYTTAGVNTITYIQNYMNTNRIKEVTLGFVVESWSNGTKVGESTELMNKVSFKNAEPTISYTEEETDAKVISLLGTSGDTPVQNVSKLKYTITPVAQHGATITSVVVNHDIQYTPTKVGNDYIVTIPIKTKFITISVTDNRGNFNAVVITKSNLIEYQAVDISPNFTIRRINPTSSTIRFNLTARYYQQTFGSYTNAPHLYYKLDNNARVEIPSSAYVIDNTNHTLTLTNYDVANLLVYTSSGQFTLQLEDLLTTDEEGGTNGYVLKGIPTFEVGEHDLQVNGNLLVADENGENPVNVLDKINEASLDVYSTTETRIGTWVDGKPVYRKVFNVGPIYSGTVAITHGITNLNWVIHAYGSAMTGGSWYNLDRVSTEACNQQIAVVASGSQLLVVGGTNANFTQGCWVVIEYVKTS